MLRLSELESVMKLKQALGIQFDEGACFGVTDSSRLRPSFRSMQKFGEMKDIFIVDGCLKISPVKIPASVWERKVFSATVNSFPVVVMRGGWSKFTTYAGFETEQEAKDFKKAVLAKKARQKRKKRGKKFYVLR